MQFQAAFAISLIALIITVKYAVSHSKNRLVTLTVGTYVMLFVMLFPFGFLHMRWGVLQHAILSIIKTAQVVALNRELETEIELYNLPTWFIVLYNVWLTALYALAPLLTAGFILNFSRRIRCWIRWHLNRKKEVWVFSEPSEKALILAESVLQKDSKEDVCVVFCDADGEYYDRIVEINAIGVPTSIEELDRNYLTRKPATLLFMSEDEQRNLEKTMRFVRRRRDEITKPTLIYCFHSRPEAGLLLNTMTLVNGEATDHAGDRLRFCRVSGNRYMVYQELLKIGCDVNQNPPGTTLRFMIVGCGWIGEEVLKALLWLFVQYNLVIDVIDRKGVSEQFYRKCPGLLTEKRDGFRINFIENEDIHTFDISQLEDAAGIQYVFVALGNDIANVECSVCLRQSFRRMHILRGDALENRPEIHTVITALEDANMDLIDHKTRYDIKPFVVGQNDYFSKILIDYELEKQALLNHLAWELYYADKQSGAKIIEFIKNDLESGRVMIKNHAKWRDLVLTNDQISQFYKDDYSSRSSRARAVFDRCFEHDPSVEHKRWVAYMLTEGYQYGERTDHLAKLHRDIRLQTAEEMKACDERDYGYQAILEKITGRNNQ